MLVKDPITITDRARIIYYPNFVGEAAWCALVHPSYLSCKDFSIASAYLFSSIARPYTCLSQVQSNYQLQLSTSLASPFYF